MDDYCTLVAYHEAAHAVIAHRLGYRVERVTVARRIHSGRKDRRTITFQSVGYTRHQNMLAKVDLKKRRKFRTRYDRRQVEHAAMVAAAGTLGERLLSMKRMTKQGDLDQATATLQLPGTPNPYLGLGDDDLAKAINVLSYFTDLAPVQGKRNRLWRYFLHVEAKAWWLVRRHHRSIATVAAALLVNETLEQPTLNRLLRNPPCYS